MFESGLHPPSLIPCILYVIYLFCHWCNKFCFATWPTAHVKVHHMLLISSPGQASLSWISRVQIALDTARGLEYIHEHTKDQYVHRDIKTSNILLNSSFRAKVFPDFTVVFKMHCYDQ